MIRLTYHASWPGEVGAGIRASSEDVEITLKHATFVDEDTIEYFRESISEYFDGAKVVLTSWEKNS